MKPSRLQTYYWLLQSSKWLHNNEWPWLKWLVKNGTMEVVANTVFALVANTVWAFATSKTKTPKLLAAIEVRLDWLVKNGTTRLLQTQYGLLQPSKLRYHNIGSNWILAWYSGRAWNLADCCQYYGVFAMPKAAVPTFLMRLKFVSRMEPRCLFQTRYGLLQCSTRRRHNYSPRNHAGCSKHTVGFCKAQSN